ncbi:hypothetical protein AZ468_04735 [Vibrio europaeus]|uniref:Uncharacterized protein n=1 Tax=Vibrio europaeus TaxID=300876 RepID=A0A178JE04_9VIBR|nr:hypothetical protein AZ468_04735 [Vibrio europaeus]
MYIGQLANQNTTDETCLAKNALDKPNSQVHETDLDMATFQHQRNHTKELNKRTTPVNRLWLIQPLFEKCHWRDSLYLGTTKCEARAQYS